MELFKNAFNLFKNYLVSLSSADFAFAFLFIVMFVFLINVIKRVLNR